MSCAVCHLFPHLVALHVKITIYSNEAEDDEDMEQDDDDEEPPLWAVCEFIDAVTKKSPLPANIQKLAIQWDYTGENSPSHIHFGPDLDGLAESLILQHPNMKAIWLDGTALLFFWRKGDCSLQYHERQVTAFANDGNRHHDVSPAFVSDSHCPATTQRLMDSLPRPSSRSNETSSAKLWAVYISEAEKYDKALVESWRSDMDGLLIFAGLFSASLTAFLIESYKTLTPDMNVILLAQISHQLATASNGTILAASSPTAGFSPSTSALVCNTLWFISLSLSLSCALVATLLEQWARNFLHRADMCSAPVIRARMFSFLYYGLKRFNMHMVVEIVPLLLHAALLFFFGGLVAFLAPVNRPIMFLSAALLGIGITCYFSIAVLPLRYLDCPYHTPLSGVLWRFFAWAREHLSSVRLMDGTPPSGFQTMVEAISRRAVESSDERTIRDRRALVWTLKSLGDENELEPLVESIPDLLRGPDGRRCLFDDSIIELVSNPDVLLATRIEDLLLSCNSGLLSSEAMIRRQIMCLKALWCIASLADLAPARDLGDDLFDLSLTGRVPFSDNATVNHYAVSTRALTRWSVFCSIRSQVLQTLRYIKICQDIVATE
ncbi:hypothetical protein FB451DRAFT_1412464 [Mycena latifolia]|nr:hypothetical protein FB451DRAFT_1412464 [Mycena latifolia]